MIENPTETLATEFSETQASSTAVAVRDEPKGNGFTYLPATFDKACEWSDYISRSGLVPDAFKTPVGAPKDASKGRDVYLACARGAELGMKPLQSLMNIAVVNGRTTLSTDAKKALCMQYGDIQSVYDEKDGIPKWTCTAKRNGHSDVVISFSAQDAVVAGLMTCEWVNSPDGKSKVRIWKGRSNAWVHYWKRMLLKRAMSWCCDEAFPDVLSGFGTTEDYSDMEAPAATTENIVTASAPAPVPRALRKKKAEAPVDPVEPASEPIEVEAEVVEDKPKYNPDSNADFLPILDSMPDKDIPELAHTTALYRKWAQRFAKCLNLKELDVVADALKQEQISINPFDSSALRSFYKSQKAKLENN